MSIELFKQNCAQTAMHAIAALDHFQQSCRFGLTDRSDRGAVIQRFSGSAEVTSQGKTFRVSYNPTRGKYVEVNVSLVGNPNRFREDFTTREEYNAYSDLTFKEQEAAEKIFIKAFDDIYGPAADNWQQQCLHQTYGISPGVGVGRICVSVDVRRILTFTR